MLGANSGTITKCLTLGHFLRFPQVDVALVWWHLSAPHRTGGNGANPESLLDSLGLLGRSQRQ